MYNAYVKEFGYPLAIAAMQLGVGLLYAIPMWILGIRKMPKITMDDLLLLLPIGKVFVWHVLFYGCTTPTALYAH